MTTLDMKNAQKTKDYIKDLSKKQFKDFVKKFKAKIEETGEVLFDTSNEYIKMVFTTQGFWSGVRIRLFYDKKANSFYSQERRFGYNA